MTLTTYSIFISYETSTGLEYAREARRIFMDAGHEAWMWDGDRRSGHFPAEEIANNIKLCDIMFYLCTATGQDQPSWNGQEYERNLAWILGKPFLPFSSYFRWPR